MRVDVLWTPGEVEGYRLAGRRAVVIDAIRASTTILAALEAGVSRVVPAASREEALRLAEGLRDGTSGGPPPLLCGERGGRRVEGYDLGNSPSEYVPERVAGRIAVFDTTNGTGAIRRVAAADTLLLACYANRSAAARELAAGEGDPLVVCAGREGRVGLDDALCAGLLVERMMETGDPELGDGALAALELARRLGPPDADRLARTEAGRALVRVGLEGDLEWCARLDASRAVPVLENGVLRLGSAAGAPAL